MINYLWALIVIFSIVCSFFTGKIDSTCEAILTGTKNSVDFLIFIAGTMAFWSGIINIAKKSDFTNLISKIFKPIIKFFFPSICEDKSLMGSICLTFTANFLGLSNATTPLAISTISKIEGSRIVNSEKYSIINMFIILNIASVQIMPSMLIALRKKYMSCAPFEVLPFVWMTSLFSCIFGVLLINFFKKPRFLTPKVENKLCREVLRRKRNSF